MGCTYAELDRGSEEVGTSLLGNGITALDARQVDESGLDNSGLTLDSLQNLLGEAGIKSEQTPNHANG